MSVIVTVPHAACPHQSDPRRCDRVSEQVARMLVGVLEQQSCQTILHINDSVQRSVVDMNRKVSRTTEWRKQLRALFETEQIVYHIDVHSFISDDSKRRQVLVYALHEWGTKSLETVKLMKALTPRGELRYPIYRGGENDIHREALLEYKIPSVLLEFNETAEDAELGKVTQTLGEWICERIKPTD